MNQLEIVSKNGTVHVFFNVVGQVVTVNFEVQGILAKSFDIDAEGFFSMIQKIESDGASVCDIDTVRALVISLGETNSESGEIWIKERGTGRPMYRDSAGYSNPDIRKLYKLKPCDKC